MSTFKFDNTTKETRKKWLGFMIKTCCKVHWWLTPFAVLNLVMPDQLLETKWRRSYRIVFCFPWSVPHGVLNPHFGPSLDASSFLTICSHSCVTIRLKDVVRFILQSHLMVLWRQLACAKGCHAAFGPHIVSQMMWCHQITSHHDVPPTYVVIFYYTFFVKKIFLGCYVNRL